MVPVEEKRREGYTPPPSSGLAFMVGMMLFAMIFCPAGIFIFYNLAPRLKGELTAFSYLSLGCFAGLIIAVIPAYIFMRIAMKKARK